MNSQPVFMDTLPAVYKVEESGGHPLKSGCQCLPASASPASASPASASPASASPADAVGHQDRAGHGTGRDTGQGGTRDRAGHVDGLDTGHPYFRGWSSLSSAFAIVAAAFFYMIVLRFWELSMSTAIVVLAGFVAFVFVFFTSLAFSASAKSALFRSLTFSLVVFLPGLLGKLAQYALQLDFWVLTRDFWLFFFPAVLCTIYAVLSAVVVFAFLSRRRLGAAAREI